MSANGDALGRKGFLDSESPHATTRVTVAIANEPKRTERLRINASDHLFSAPGQAGSASRETSWYCQPGTAASVLTGVRSLPPMPRQNGLHPRIRQTGGRNT